MNNTNNVHAVVLDTCLPCYVTADVPGLMHAPLGYSLEQTIDWLISTIHEDSHVEAISTRTIRDAVREALRGADLRYIDGTTGERLNARPDTEEEIEPHIYVALRW